MSVIGFNINKIDAEKKSNPTGKINVNSNVSIQKVEVTKLNIGNPNENAIDFTFEFKTEYEPDFGHIKLAGNVLFLTKDADKVVEEWKKTKKLTPEVMKPVFNTILSKGNVEALLLSKELNLPSPLRLPKVKDGEE